MSVQANAHLSPSRSPPPEYTFEFGYGSMASITPRASALLAQDYFEDVADEDIDVEAEAAAQDVDRRTPLDKTIDRIGMGSYQWTLLALCGFGWLADNMWIQTVAIILPRVQRHFEVSDGRIGYLSSFMFAGMMIGAVGWGSCSDLLGRSTAFNLTLFFTAVFGIVASLAPTFTTLCIALFFLGTSVGGSMPTDGTLLLEHMPKGKQYMVTALSVFFSFGSVLSAVVGILVIPGHSCLGDTPCDVATENTGWKILLLAIGLITLSFFIARIVFFKLHESPRYLVHAGRHEEARVNLQKISRFNGSELSVSIHDVIDTQKHLITEPDDMHANEESAPFIPRMPDSNTGRTDVRTIFDAGAEAPGERTPTAVSEREPLSAISARERRERAAADAAKSRASTGSGDRPGYDSTGSSDVPLSGHIFKTPAEERPPLRDERRNTRVSFNDYPPSMRSVSVGGLTADEDEEDEEGKVEDSPKTPLRPRLRDSREMTRVSMASMRSRRSSFQGAKSKVYWALPRRVRKPLWAWLDKIGVVLGPEWRTTTLLVWAMWCSMSLAYTMFNVFLPKMLEMQTGGEVGGQPKSLKQTMWDVVIFTIAGCPGAILGAFMIESSWGRRWSLAGSTLVTALFCVAFAFAESSFFVRLSTIGISLSSTAMWAVLYGWTPEIFATSVRGTACGTASALSRIGGMIAPVLGGALLMISRPFPVYASVVVFVVAAVCTLLLRVDESRSRKGGDGGVLAH